MFWILGAVMLLFLPVFVWRVPKVGELSTSLFSLKNITYIQGQGL